jgi:hypothetical protein
MRRIGMAVLGLAAMTVPLAAQRAALREVSYGNGGSLGIDFVIAEPSGAFRRHGDVAAGIGFNGVTAGNAFAVRFDGSWMVYDATYQGYGVSTTSQIGTLMIGPQLTLGQGPMRVYGFLAGGGSLFWSNASYNDGCGCSGSDFLDGDLTFSRSVGGGVLMSITRRHNPISLDIGVREVRHDRVTYVPAGGLSDNGDGTFTANRVQTPVVMRVWQVGVSVGLR